MKRFLGKGKDLVTLFFITLVFLMYPLLSVALEKPKWLKDFEEFAEKSGDSYLIERARTLGIDEALKIGKEWEEYMGFNGVDLISKAMSKYPDIKPGTVITENNYKDFPSLKKLLPESTYKRLGKGSYAQFGNITIVPTSHYYPYKEFIEATKRNEGKAKIGSKKELINWNGGYPFPKSENAMEILYNFDRIGGISDNFYFAPDVFTMYDRKGKVERIEKCDLQWMYFRGRLRMDPKPIVPGYEDIFEKGSILMSYPYDLKGFAGVRTRFVDPNKPDEFMTYIPAIRRIRKLSGTDTQDPIIGTDFRWEDWRAWWQKFELWPADYTVKRTEALLPIRPHDPTIRADEAGRITGYWEIKPVWLLEQKLKTPNYYLMKRKAWIDMERYDLIWVELYDHRGNLWRDEAIYMRFLPNGDSIWTLADTIDFVNSHRTLMRPNAIINAQNITKDWFDIKYLIRIGH